MPSRLCSPFNTSLNCFRSAILLQTICGSTRYRGGEDIVSRPFYLWQRLLFYARASSNYLPFYRSGDTRRWYYLIQKVRQHDWINTSSTLRQSPWSDRRNCRLPRDETSFILTVETKKNGGKTRRTGKLWGTQRIHRPYLHANKQYIHTHFDTTDDSRTNEGKSHQVDTFISTFASAHYIHL